MENKNIIFKVVAVITIIVLMLGASLFVIFDGIIGVIEEVLGNILGFLSNPIGFISQAMQDLNNTWTNTTGIGQFHFDPTETCTFFLSNDLVEELATNLEGAGIVTTNKSQGSSSTTQNSVSQATLDLEEAGLTTDTLRKLILASYVTQATTDTQIGIEIPTDEEVEEAIGEKNKEKLDNEYDKQVNKGGSYASLTVGDYYYIKQQTTNNSTGDIEVKYFVATKGVIQVVVVDENGKQHPLRCYNNERFQGWMDWFNEEGTNGETAARSYEDTMFYTVPEIGKITLIANDNKSSFSAKTIDYTTDSEISKCVVPLELLVDFLNISASSDFLYAFEELVKDQDIILQVASLTTTVTTNTTTTQDVDVQASVTKNVTFSRKEANTAEQDSTNMEQNKKPNKMTKIFEKKYNVSDTMVTKSTNTTTSTTYDIAVIEADSWYFKASRDADVYTSIDNTEEDNKIAGYKFSGASLDDCASSIEKDAFNRIKANIENRANRTDDIQSNINQYKNEGNYDYYTFDGFNYFSVSGEAYEGNEHKEITTITETLTKGVMKYEDNTDAFLGLWKNNTGQYERGATFVQDGKKVGYADLYGDDDAIVGDLFENGDEMLFELLESSASSERTQSYSWVMRYILYRYTGKDYGVTDFETLLRLMGLTTVSTSDYNVNTNSTAGSKLKIVATDDGKSAKENLINGINSIANPNYREKCQRLIPYADLLITLQEKYGVNPAWIIAQSYNETHCGTDKNSSAQYNNWSGYGYDRKG